MGTFLTLIYVNMQNNEVSLEGAKLVARMLTINTSLECLDLNVGAYCCLFLYQRLTHIQFNLIGEEGPTTIAKSLQNNHSLLALLVDVSKQNSSETDEE